MRRPTNVCHGLSRTMLAVSIACTERTPNAWPRKCEVAKPQLVVREGRWPSATRTCRLPSWLTCAKIHWQIPRLRNASTLWPRAVPGSAAPPIPESRPDPSSRTRSSRSQPKTPSTPSTNRQSHRRHSLPGGGPILRTRARTRFPSRDPFAFDPQLPRRRGE